jgi:hypothetical protein
MLVLFLAAAVASPPPEVQPASATAQATATIRILSAVQLKLDGTDSPGLPPVRSTSVQTTDGTQRPAKLIEFQ